MASKSRAALNRAAKVTTLRDRGTGADPISLRLRQLQAERVDNTGDVHDTIEALVPAIAAASTAGHLVSITKVRGSSTVLLRIRDGEDWLDWYCAEPSFAEAVSDEIVKAFSGD